MRLTSGAFAFSRFTTAFRFSRFTTPLRWQLLSSSGQRRSRSLRSSEAMTSAPRTRTARGGPNQASRSPRPVSSWYSSWERICRRFSRLTLRGVIVIGPPSAQVEPAPLGGALAQSPLCRREVGLGEQRCGHPSSLGLRRTRTQLVSHHRPGRCPSRSLPLARPRSGSSAPPRVRRRAGPARAEASKRTPSCSRQPTWVVGRSDRLPGRVAAGWQSGPGHKRSSSARRGSGSSAACRKPGHRCGRFRTE